MATHQIPKSAHGAPRIFAVLASGHTLGRSTLRDDYRAVSCDVNDYRQLTTLINVDNRLLMVMIIDRMDQLLTVGEVAQILRISENTVRALLQRGKIPAIKIGRAWRIREIALDDLIRGSDVRIDKRADLKIV
jgi:excisionase family DNA binding protein